MPDQPRALWNQQNAPGHRVEDVLGDMRHHGAGQIRVKACDQAGGYDAAGHHLIRGGRCLQDMPIIDAVGPVPAYEVQLALLVVLIVVRIERQAIRLHGHRRTPGHCSARGIGRIARRPRRRLHHHARFARLGGLLRDALPFGLGVLLLGRLYRRRALRRQNSRWRSRIGRPRSPGNDGPSRGTCP